MLFNLKAQCLPEISKEGLSKNLEIEASIACQILPTEEGMLNKKGNLYIVLNIKCKAPSDLKTTITLFLENLKDSYYKEDDEPILQSLEKSLKKSVNIMANAEYSFCAVAIRDRVLYLSYLGSPAAFLIRGTNTPKDLIGKGNIREIWTFTNLLFGDEILLICTDALAKKFSSETILNALPTLSLITKPGRQNNSNAAILIKITPLETKPGKSFSVTFKYDLLKTRVAKIIEMTKVIRKSNPSLYDQFKHYNTKRNTPALTINGWKPTWAVDFNLKGARQYRKLSNLAKHSSKSYLAQIIGLILIGSAALIGIKYYIDQARDRDLKRDLVSSISNRQINPTIEDTNDNKDTENEPAPYQFDLKTINDSFNLLGLSYLKENNLVALDQSTRALYLINLPGKSSKKILDKFTNPEYLTCQDGICYVYDSENIFLINPDRAPLYNKFFIGVTNVIDIRANGGSVYILTTEGIKTITITSINQSKVDDYIKSIDVKTRSFVNDGNTYLLGPSGVTKYLGTKKDLNFSLTTQIEFKNPSQILSLDNKLFILEPDTKALLVFDKNTGNLLEQKFLMTEGDKPVGLFTIGDRKKQYIYYVVDNRIFLYQ